MEKAACYLFWEKSYRYRCKIEIDYHDGNSAHERLHTSLLVEMRKGLNLKDTIVVSLKTWPTILIGDVIHMDLEELNSNIPEYLK